MSLLWSTSSTDKNSWHTLDDIIQSTLGDVIQADANFQLRQAEAWREFSESIHSLGDYPSIKTVDFTVGFGRLENLAIEELDVALPLDKFVPNLARRLWISLLNFMGIASGDSTQQSLYRLSHHRAGAKNRVEFKIKVTRRENGQWEAQALGEGEENSVPSIP